MQGIGRLSRDFEDKGVIYVLDDRILNNNNVMLKEYLESKSRLLSYEDVLSKREAFEESECNVKSSIFALLNSYYPIISIDEVIEKFKIDADDVIDISKACKKLVSNKIFISEIEKCKVEEKLKKEKFDFWILLGELLISKYTKQTNQKVLSTIIENKFFDNNNFQEFIKSVLLEGSSYKEIKEFCDFARHGY